MKNGDVNGLWQKKQKTKTNDKKRAKGLTPEGELSIL